MTARSWTRVAIALIAAGCLAAAAAAATPGLTFKPASGTNLAFGQTATFKGAAGTKKGTVVTLLVQPCGFSAPAPTITTKTGAKGAFKFSFRPVIGVLFRAKADSKTSSGVRISIKPSVLIRRVAAGRYAVDVQTGAGAFLKKPVVIQRAVGKRWVPVGSATMKQNSAPTALIAVSSATVKAKVKAGSKVRALLPAKSAAPCYAPAASPAISG